MRIFKKEFSEELTDGMSIGECIITKVNDTQYGTFIVHKKLEEGTFPYLGVFGILQDAIKFVKCVENSSPEYEYYLQFRRATRDTGFGYQNIEGKDYADLAQMGSLGWELCGIDCNIQDPIGKSLYIYKRRIINEIESLEKDDIEYTAPSRLIENEESPNSIRYHFGKNGQGITDELILLGEKLKDLSVKNRVYLKSAFFDTIDDVYDITIELL